MINEIKTRLEGVIDEATAYFARNGYEVRGEVEVSDVEDGYNTYVFPALHITCPEDNELSAGFGFTVEIDKDGKYNDAEIESDVNDFLAKAKEYAEVIDNAENKCEAIRELDRKLAKEVENAIKEEAERTAAREKAAIRATYRQMLIAGGVMAAVAIIFFVISKLL